MPITRGEISLGRRVPTSSALAPLNELRRTFRAEPSRLPNKSKAQEYIPMTKAELVEAVSKAADDVSKTTVQAIIDETFNQIAKVLKKDKKFSVSGFGTFVVRQRKARTGRNPRTGETIKIKPSKSVGFKPSPQLKKAL
jgi:DNA-binding protein HU-beta